MLLDRHEPTRRISFLTFQVTSELPEVATPYFEACNAAGQKPSHNSVTKKIYISIQIASPVQFSTSTADESLVSNERTPNAYCGNIVT